MAGCLGAFLTASCSGLGPASLNQERIDYGLALAETAKREMLLNIVRLRFGDTPTLMQVSQIVAGYSFEGRADFGTNLFQNGYWLGNDIAANRGGTFSNRPTITYNPVRGEQYARTMLAPLPPNELIAMLTSGAPADETLRLTVKSMNGLNMGPALTPSTTAPQFAEALRLIEQLRAEDILGIRF